MELGKAVHPHLELRLRTTVPKRESVRLAATVALPAALYLTS